MLVEGSSMRSISRGTDVSLTTVTKLLVDAGVACHAWHDEKAGASERRGVQADEIWSFTYCKERTVDYARRPPPGAGSDWTWTAMDADRRFTRLTNAFGKKLANHGHQMALFCVRYNWVRIHETLRVTLAMEAGLTDEFRDLDWIVSLVEGLGQAARSSTEGPRRGRLAMASGRDAGAEDRAVGLSHGCGRGIGLGFGLRPLAEAEAAPGDLVQLAGGVAGVLVEGRGKAFRVDAPRVTDGESILDLGQRHRVAGFAQHLPDQLVNPGPALAVEQGEAAGIRLLFEPTALGDEQQDGEGCLDLLQRGVPNVLKDGIRDGHSLRVAELEHGDQRSTGRAVRTACSANRRREGGRWRPVCYREVLPEGCPPDTAREVTEERLVFRIVQSNTPTAADFESWRKLNPDGPVESARVECRKLGLSVFATREDAEEKLILRSQRGRQVRAVRLTAGAGTYPTDGDQF